MQASLSKKIALTFYILFAAGLLLALLIMLMELLEDGNFANSWPIAAISTGGLLATFFLSTILSNLQRKRQVMRSVKQKSVYSTSKQALKLQ